jgi:acyl dehydratase
MSPAIVLAHALGYRRADGDGRTGMAYQYFDDFRVGDKITAGPYVIDRGEMMEFARKWDPIPIHVDEGFGKTSVHGDVIGSGVYTIAVKQVLIMSRCGEGKLIGAMGYDRLKFARPVYAGDALSMVMAVASKRASRSRPDCGIVVFDVTVSNQRGEAVLESRDVVLYFRRPP